VATAIHRENGSFPLSRASRALLFLSGRRPGVPLRSTPGFMLPPAPRVLEDHWLEEINSEASFPKSKDFYQ
jgi:hypothetical protein